VAFVVFDLDHVRAALLLRVFFTAPHLFFASGDESRRLCSLSTPWIYSSNSRLRYIYFAIFTFFVARTLVSQMRHHLLGADFRADRRHPSCQPGADGRDFYTILIEGKPV